MEKPGTEAGHHHGDTLGRLGQGPAGTSFWGQFAGEERRGPSAGSHSPAPAARSASSPPATPRPPSPSRPVRCRPQCRPSSASYAGPLRKMPKSLAICASGASCLRATATTSRGTREIGLGHRNILPARTESSQVRSQLNRGQSPALRNRHYRRLSDGDGRREVAPLSVPRCRTFPHCNVKVFIWRRAASLKSLTPERGIRHAVAHHDCCCVIRMKEGPTMETLAVVGASLAMFRQLSSPPSRLHRLPAHYLPSKAPSVRQAPIAHRSSRIS